MTVIHLRNFNMASARLIGGLIFVPLLGAFFIYGAMSYFEPNEQSLGDALGGVGLLFVVLLSAIGFAWMALTAVTSLTIGEELAVSSIFASRKYPLADISLIEFESEGARVDGLMVARHLMMHVYLRSGRHVQVKLNNTEAQEVVSGLGARGLEEVFQQQSA